MCYIIMLGIRLRRDFVKIPPQAQRLLLARSRPWQAPGGTVPEKRLWAAPGRKATSSVRRTSLLKQLNFNSDVARSAPGAFECALQRDRSSAADLRRSFRTSQRKRHRRPVQNAIQAASSPDTIVSPDRKSRGEGPQLAPVNRACNAESGNNNGKLRGYVLAHP